MGYRNAGDEMIGAATSGAFAMQRTSRITVRCTGNETQALAVRSAPAVVPQIGHRIGKGLECVV